MRCLSHVCAVAVAVVAVVVSAAGCLAPAPPPPPPAAVWSPGVTYPSEPTTFRGFVDMRGLVHAHSVYSHDACDGEPVLADGSRDPVCFEDFRRGLCQSKHDFVFLTDHRDAFDDTEFPDTVLHRPELGDELVEHDDVGPTASWAACDTIDQSGHRALIMAGAEAGMMPVGLEGHAAPQGERGELYGAQTVDAADRLRAQGAIVLLAHPEDYSVDELRALPVDGFEMFNLHSNTLVNAGIALELILRQQEGDTLPHPDLLVLALWSEEERYLTRWGRVLAGGKRVVSTMGTDCHRNTFITILEDGERADSYRRMMISFSNHLRARPLPDGTVDDRVLKEALAAGRNWGAFEMLGYPVGFDAFASDGAADFEIGDVVPAGSTLHVVRPSIKDLDPSREAPRITVRVLRAIDDEGGFVEVASSSEDAQLDVVLDDPGAYRAEVRMLPTHLREDMRFDAASLLDAFEADDRDYVWIYTGAFYVE